MVAPINRHTVTPLLMSNLNQSFLFPNHNHQCKRVITEGKIDDDEAVTNT